MEDEDGESKIIDMWNILEEKRLKDSTLGNALKHSIDDIYTDGIEEERQLIRYKSIITSDSSGKNTIAEPNFVFKGFKKRILAEAREVPTIAPKNSVPEIRQSTHLNAKAGKDKRVERKRKRKITEYAQYLGLRPSTRYKCSKCYTWSNCGPDSKQNSCACNPSMTPMPSTSESSAAVPHASNFKITRKVYLCSACGTYFENWNLFLHMRDIHKRHICLYCLGMFGQPERLSYHLMKKHSVPEMAFSSVEDFYNAFKGSCYLICCSCEKVFSETDDFFNHFCSPVLDQSAAANVTSMCTICRQTGTHASTCNFSLDAEKEVRNASTPLAVADTMYADGASPIVPPSEITTNLGGKGLPRKGIKYNRRKRGKDVVQNARQQKSNTLARKLGTKVQCNENQFDSNLDVQRDITNSLPRDTVTETIMEVSRYRGNNSSDENDENDEQAMNKDVSNNRDRGSGKSPVQNCQLEFSEPYDSVTETIMEVSRYIGEEDKKEDAVGTLNVPTSNIVEQTNVEEEGTCEKNDIVPSRLVGSRAPSPAQWNNEEIAVTDTKMNATCEIVTKCDSPQDTRSCSPINRSLFSPQHESHISDSQSKEGDHIEEVDKKKVEKPIANSTESQASVSFNASSDRSLVIKICNRNSQFSVATTTVTSRESEENNNAEGSSSKKRMPNGSEIERDIIDDDQTNELDDSDSDSDKLAVVDSNPEEDEEVDDGEEGEEADEAEDKRDNVEDESQRNQRENDETKSETYTDGFFSITETVPIVNTNEILDSHADEGITSEPTKSHTIDNNGIVLAGEDVPCIDLNVEGTLDSMDLEELLKRCIEAASPICVYCNHARYIAVNGKQLSLHMLAEHKFQPQHPAIIIHPDQFTARVKRSLDELESRYFNLDSYNSTDGTYNVPNVLIYECFHCRFHSTVHKELYLHNRKMHQKTILICIMCKSTFYSYSELVCHLCPGIYSPNANLRYRCCLCSVANLPSAFRLMVHVRKRHHACDVCLESTGNQQRLSNHVWKHKLHHLCYRCGIAYRNKPDITKHLFWKHGTESVLCRKCLQKKWPHIYHFCIPPTAFVCEECGSSFGRAVALKVHKRLHSGDLPYGCDECEQRFISRKLLAKHQAAHREPEPEETRVNTTSTANAPLAARDDKSDKDAPVTAIDGDPTTGDETTSRNMKEAVKKVVDVYDLPPLNLSSESDTDSEEEKLASAEKPAEKESVDEDATKKNGVVEAVDADDDDDDVATPINDIAEVERNEEEKKQEARIMDGIWDNFKTYAASLDVEESAKNVALKESVPETDAAYLRSIILSDHDYCVIYTTDKENNENHAAASAENDAKTEETKSKRSPSPATPNGNECDSDTNKRKVKSPKKKKRSGSASSTSDSSSDTDSSSCSCGTNCSCSSSSSGSSSSSSSSSDSDSSASDSSPRKQSGGRRDRNKKERESTRENKSQSVEPENRQEEKSEIPMENGPTIPELETSEVSQAKLLLRESDLETEETETDEDFYDEYPQLLANKLLAEKRNQLLLLAAVAPASTPVSTPTSTSTSTLMSVEQSSMPLNNGILVAETTLSDPIAMSIDNQQQQQQQQKKRTKIKKRRRGERGGKRNATATESIKLNIPKVLYQKNAGFAASSQPMHPNSRSSTPNQLPHAATCNDYHSSNAVNVPVEMQQQQQAVIGTPNQNVGAETENKRVSKRKRVPKRFYGDSSDDEPQEKQSFGRWRKTETTSSAAIASGNPVFTPATTLNPKPLVSRLSLGKTVQTNALPESSPMVAPASATESEDPVESSSDSSESETENTTGIVNQPKINNPMMPIDASTAERPGKIYCYCRCPYDEVSEMIACDGEDCRIEWFHFECVGIMVPPKGKWYCPDCRKKHGIVQNDEYFD